MERKILEDIVQVYRFLESQNQAVNALYNAMDCGEISEMLHNVFKEIPDNTETRFACVDRVIGLKEGGLLTILQKLGIQENKVLQLRAMLLGITCDFHMQKHRKVLNFIQDNALLTPFWRELLESIHRIGEVFNLFFVQWQERLILGINKDLNAQFNGDMEAILKALESSFECCAFDFVSKGGFSAKGELSDRSYSVPILKDSVYHALAYADFFKDCFNALDSIFTKSLESLEKIPEVCPKLEQKESHIAYLSALQTALMQTNTGLLLESWRLVDKAWMQISTPLQIGHPLEYYEDHFRKAVAPEWDLRIARIYNGVDLLGSNTNVDCKISKESMWEFYATYSAKMQKTPFKDSIDKCVKNALNQTQSYGGMPLLFYGAELNGIFSAQVVPNDERVSVKFGKKIFYFPDRVRELSMAKPFMLLASKTFPKEFLDFNRILLYFRKDDWYKVYEISTVGHEFGHILWVDFDSELLMNVSGQFKNIEEFKATMGGIAYYFTQIDKPLLKELVFSIIARAVGLIAWMQEDEVLPYYCESLIHLDVLFNAGILRYRGCFDAVALEVDVNANTLQALEKKYLNVYDKLIETYLNKQDAKVFLECFMLKDDKGCYKPKNKNIRAFVEDYYAQYLAIGQVQDSITSKMWKEAYIKGQNATNH